MLNSFLYVSLASHNSKLDILFPLSMLFFNIFFCNYLKCVKIIMGTNLP